MKTKTMELRAGPWKENSRPTCVHGCPGFPKHVAGLCFHSRA